jgi:hypothetical protein
MAADIGGVVGIVAKVAKLTRPLLVTELRCVVVGRRADQIAFSKYYHQIRDCSYTYKGIKQTDYRKPLVK